MKLLQTEADNAGVRLLEAFKNAGVPTSTYYRASNGADLRHVTAAKVHDEIKLHSLQGAKNN